MYYIDEDAKQSIKMYSHFLWSKSV